MPSKYNIDHLKNKIVNDCSPERAKLLQDFINDLGKPFEDAPASSRVRYHEAYAGGLIDHIMKFIDYTVVLTPGMIELRREALTTVAILHDIHKVGDSYRSPYYVPNILKSGKQSDAEPYSCNDKYLSVDASVGSTPFEKELLFLSQYDGFTGGQHSIALIYAMSPPLYKSLTPDEIQAIQYHDGGYTSHIREISGKESVLQIICHAADMLASRQDRHANKES